ncbi:MAG: hypothetical protein SPK26_02790 [Treponema sp.]|nr:hypothetical protein [Treponema sp.]
MKIQNEALPKTKGGESLPLAPKQVAPRIVPASSAASLRFVACPLPLLAGTPRNAPCQHSDKKEESRQNTSFRLFQFAHKKGRKSFFSGFSVVQGNVSPYSLEK